MKKKNPTLVLPGMFDPQPTDPLFTPPPPPPWTGASPGTRVHSRDAAQRIEVVAGSLRWQVLREIADHTHGLTDEEIQQRCCLGGNTERPRRIELLSGGLIMSAGRSRKTASGRDSTVWVVTPAGREVVGRSA